MLGASVHGCDDKTLLSVTFPFQGNKHPFTNFGRTCGSVLIYGSTGLLFFTPSLQERVEEES
jgi:hypothetical protein